MTKDEARVEALLQDGLPQAAGVCVPGMILNLAEHCEGIATSRPSQDITLHHEDLISSLRVPQPDSRQQVPCACAQPPRCRGQAGHADHRRCKFASCTLGSAEMGSAGRKMSVPLLPHTQVVCTMIKTATSDASRLEQVGHFHTASVILLSLSPRFVFSTNSPPRS